MDRNCIILGGGISGLSAGWRLAERGVPVTVLESSPQVGGLAGTVREDGYCLDYGPHSFFSEDAEIVDTVLKLFDHKLVPTPRDVKFYYRGKYLNYPITATSVLFQMGIASGCLATLSFLKGKIFPRPKAPIRPGEDETVEDWAIESFGEHLYRSFFKPYTEQFWKIPCTELSARSIPSHTRTSFANTLRLLLRKKVSKEGDSLIERETLPTYYPDTGYAEISERVAAHLTRLGGKIHVAARATAVGEMPGGRMRVTFVRDGRQTDVEGSHVISTIPLPGFISMLHPSPPGDVVDSANALEYRALVMLGMVTEKQDVLGCGYMYLLDRPYNRISELNKFSPATSPPGENIIAVEMTVLKGSPAWDFGKEELFEMCIGSLARDRILAPGDVKKLLLVKAPNAYPIYKKDYAGHLKRVLGYIQSRPHLSTLGRTGEFMYMDADKCMRRAFTLADKLVQGND